MAEKYEGRRFYDVINDRIQIGSIHSPGRLIEILEIIATEAQRVPIIRQKINGKAEDFDEAVKKTAMEGIKNRIPVIIDKSDVKLLIYADKRQYILISSKKTEDGQYTEWYYTREDNPDEGSYV
jgi:hypothetical protein